MTGRIVPEKDLDQRERAGIASLCRLLSSMPETDGMRVVLCEGGSAPVRRGRDLLLPRSDGVGRAVRLASEGDESGLYPLLLAAVGDRAEPPAQLRQAWIESVTATGIAGRRTIQGADATI
jgi:hypothetical protein